MKEEFDDDIYDGEFENEEIAEPSGAEIISRNGDWVRILSGSGGVCLDLKIEKIDGFCVDRAKSRMLYIQAGGVVHTMRYRNHEQACRIRDRLKVAVLGCDTIAGGD